MTNHVRMAIYPITEGSYLELMEKAREGMAPIMRQSPGFVFYSSAVLQRFDLELALG